MTQTLDERQSDQGKLILEIKASSLGLTPNLDELLDLAPQEFDIDKTDDQGVSVAKFEPDSEDIAVASERTWLVTLAAKAGLPHRPSEFQFATARHEGVEMVYQRYNDADLTTVEQVVALEQRYGRTSYAWLLWLLPVGIVATAIVLAIWLRPRAAPADRGVALPGLLTPFTAIGFLERLRQDPRLEPVLRGELEGSIQLLHERYFSAEGNGNANGDLRDIAASWLHRLQEQPARTATSTSATV